MFPDMSLSTQTRFDLILFAFSVAVVNLPIACKVAHFLFVSTCVPLNQVVIE